jgi:hypothetical protein
MDEKMTPVPAPVPVPGGVPGAEEAPTNRVVLAMVPVDPGTLTVVMYPEAALRFAVLTRHRGLGLTLNVAADEMRISKKMTLGGAEWLLRFTPEHLLPLQKPWDFAEMSSRELDVELESMEDERYYFHKHSIRGTLTPEMAEDQRAMEEWGKAACEEYARRAAEGYPLAPPRAHAGCVGCTEDQPNQLAHMEPGGCLYQEEEM